MQEHNNAPGGKHECPGNPPTMKSNVSLAVEEEGWRGGRNAPNRGNSACSRTQGREPETCRELKGDRTGGGTGAGVRGWPAGACAEEG